jgi:Adenylate and Guanylate cyclase catalytic domain
LTGGRVERRLAAVLTADVVGYSRLMGLDEEGTLARLKVVRKDLVDPTMASHRGRIVKTTGDGMLVEFASAVDAVRGAVEVQRGMAEQNAPVPQDQRIEFRIGIHVGDIIIDDNDIFGDGVNVAARLEGIAEPGGLCISNDAYQQVRGKVDVVCDDMGPPSWLNLVERWFGELTAKVVRRGSFASVADLEAAIAQFLEAWNENPNPFVWTATVESILAKLARCRQTLEQIKPGCTAPRSGKKKIK